MSNGTTTWTVRYTASSDNRVHCKVFHDQAAAQVSRDGGRDEAKVLTPSFCLADDASNLQPWYHRRHSTGCS